MTGRLGAPERERGAPHHQDDPNQRLDSSSSPDSHSLADIGARPAYGVVAGNARRFGASRRMAPISRCSCVRDPDVDRHRCDDDRARGYEDAARHLLSHGLMPAANRAAMQQMWQSGGESRRTAQVIAKRWELVA